MKFRKTKAGLAICPFLIWTSEYREEHTEIDVNLTFCSHHKNPDNCEGNCQEKICPLLTK